MASGSAATLQARVQKLLSSRAEIESTKALLSTLVTNGVLSSTDLAGNHQEPTVSLNELRKNLRTTLEDRQLALAEGVLKGVRQTLDRIAHLRHDVDQLDAKCESIQRYLETTKRDTQQVQTEAQSLAMKKTNLQQELDQVQQFLGRYQLTDEEIHVLYTKTLQDHDVQAFFQVMERLQQMKIDCKDLVAAGNVHCALELLDTIGKYQEVGFERLYQWTTNKCNEVEGEPSTELHRAIALLRDRPEFYNYCKECITSSRRSLIVRRFIIALTRGGPNGIPRPIEMHAHDPVRYCGDMLAWVHQAIATENEFFRVLFDGDLTISPPADDPDQCTSMVGRTFEGVARPLQVRVEQTLAAPHGIVIAYKLVHLLAFYHHTFQQLVPRSGIAQALESCRDASNTAFHQQFQLLVDAVATSAQDYAANLSATHATLDASHRLVTLMEVFQSSLLPDDEKEANLTPLFDGLLPAVQNMCERSISGLDPIDALVFQVNNLSCLQVPLARFPEASKWYRAMSDRIRHWLEEMSLLQAQCILDRSDVSSVLQKITEYEATETIGAAMEGLDGERISSVMEDLFAALMTIVFPQLDHVVQPDLRETARVLTSTKLADAYTRIYAFVHDPNHGYQTSHQTTGALGGSHAILLHTPQEVRTILELE